MPEVDLVAGDIVYLDSLHYNHLEVCRGSGKIKKGRYAFNLDGSINESKTQDILQQLRTIEV